MNNNNDATIALLEKHFDIAFAAPDGIKKLRELILSLAMQGKLVPQDPSDQPASELLKEIEKEKERLIKEGKIKKSKPLPEIKPNEIPYDLPNGWEWVRLGSISTKLTDGSHNPPKDSGVGYPMLSSQNVNFGKIDFLNPSRYVSEEDFHNENKRTNILPKDVLLTIVASLGRPAVVPDDAPKFVLQRSVAVITSPINSDYLCTYLGSPLSINYYLTHGKGTAQKGIYLGQLSAMLIALPPLAEQRRIVAKIDELMARCDELEKLRNDRDRKQIIVHTAALNHLLIAKEQSDFNTAWQFITQHFSELYAVKENVTELRKAILQLAVMGKLVPQDPNDQPASGLLKEIEKEKERLIKEGKIKKSKPLSEIKPDEIPYNLPKSWKWVRLGYIGEFINGDRGKNYPNRDEYVIEGIPWINTGHIEPNGSLTQTEMNFITREKFNSLNSGKIEKGDLVYCLRGATFGKTAIVDPYTEGAIASSLMIIRPFSPCSNHYLYRYLVSPVGRSQIFKFDNGSAQPNLSANSVRLFVYPLPPLTEQYRIVAKIDQLMALCDNLEKQIDNANSKQTNLLNAVMIKI